MCQVHEHIGKTPHFLAQAGVPCRLILVVHNEKHPLSSEDFSECRSGGHRWQTAVIVMLLNPLRILTVLSQESLGSTGDLRVQHILMLGQCVLKTIDFSVTQVDIIVGIDGGRV